MRYVLKVEPLTTVSEFEPVLNHAYGKGGALTQFLFTRLVLDDEPRFAHPNDEGARHHSILRYWKDKSAFPWNE